MTFPTIPFGTVAQRSTSVFPSAFGAKLLPVGVFAIGRIAETGGNIVILTIAPPIVTLAIPICSSIAIVLQHSDEWIKRGKTWNKGEWIKRGKTRNTTTDNTG